MKLPRHSNPALSCSDDDTRLTLQYVLIEQGHAIATSGRTLAVVPVTLEPGDEMTEGRLIPATAMTDAVEAHRLSGEETSLRLIKDGVEWDTFLKERTVTCHDTGAELSFPDWRRVVPDESPRISIGFDIELLTNLVNALPGRTGHFYLHIDPAQVRGATFVTIPKEDGFGIIMPVNHPDHKTPPAMRWAMAGRLIAAAREQCLHDREFWTAEKEADLLARMMNPSAEETP